MMRALSGIIVLFLLIPIVVYAESPDNDLDKDSTFGGIVMHVHSRQTEYYFDNGRMGMGIFSSWMHTLLNFRFILGDPTQWQTPSERTLIREMSFLLGRGKKKGLHYFSWSAGLAYLTRHHYNPDMELGERREDLDGFNMGLPVEAQYLIVAPTKTVMFNPCIGIALYGNINRANSYAGACITFGTMFKRVSLREVMERREKRRQGHEN